MSENFEPSSSSSESVVCDFVPGSARLESSCSGIACICLDLANTPLVLKFAEVPPCAPNPALDK